MLAPTNKRLGLGLFSYIWTEWISAFAILLLLLLTLIIGTGEMIHGQMLRLGESLYGDSKTSMQYSFLRVEPEKPTCDVNPNIDQRVQAQMQSNQNDEFAEIFGTTSAADVRASVLAGQKLCEEKFTFYGNSIKHLEQHPTIRPYRAVETHFFAIFQFGTDNKAVLLIIMVVLAAITATLKIHHIGLRGPSSRLDYRVYAIFMILANGFLTSSAISQYQSVIKSGVPPTHEMNIIYGLWMGLFSILTVISIYHLWVIPKQAIDKGKIGLALLAVPLYAYMAIITGFNFTFLMDYPMGQGIYLGQLVEFSSIFLNLALFIWAGMLLKQTLIIDKFLNILRPWNLTPEILTWLILLAAALPTAYTGASGIFVIAAGAIIYKEVWSAGGRRQFALATAAMSGSLGVVLRPCLLIVVVASLNKEVTTDLLYEYGMYVFLITSTLFLVVSLFFAEQKIRIASPTEAIPRSGRALLAISPYVIVFLIVWLFYKYALSTNLNEFTAPVMMPIILLIMVLYEKLGQKPVSLAAVAHQKIQSNAGQHKALDPVSVQVQKSVKAQNSVKVLESTQAQVFAEQLQPLQAVSRVDHAEAKLSFWKSIHLSSSETVGHIGALVILMALSVSVGGFLERIELMAMFPADITNIYVLITLIVLVMIFVGMIMDPFGAVILISATVAPVAYSYGIEPVHFWMMA